MVKASYCPFNVERQAGSYEYNFYSLWFVRFRLFSEAHPLSTRQKISRSAQRFPNIALFLKVCSYAHNLMHSIDRALILNILNELST